VELTLDFLTVRMLTMMDRTINVILQATVRI